jgi:hypothetical protein
MDDDMDAGHVVAIDPYISAGVQKSTNYGDKTII